MDRPRLHEISKTAESSLKINITLHETRYIRYKSNTQEEQKCPNVLLLSDYWKEVLRDVAAIEIVEIKSKQNIYLVNFTCMTCISVWVKPVPLTCGSISTYSTEHEITKYLQK
jgi:hypothetical protein